MYSYSIAIRTLGRAGDKYRKLLKSITDSASQPEKIIVVLPEGYDPPEDQLGNETFVFCPKSMIGQRIEALRYIDSEYTLFLDDDIEFDSAFIEKLLEPLEQGLYDCSTGPLFSFFPASFAGKIAGTLTASVAVSVFHRDMYVKILRSGGWSYHTFNTQEKRYYPTESFAWTCFAIRTEVMRALQMEEEKRWLERFGYASGDDRVMAYKLVNCGYKACIVSNAVYIHNDGKTSTAANEVNTYKQKFCMYYMHTVFWNRFIQGKETKPIVRLQNWICFHYWYFSMMGYCALKALRPGGKKQLQALREGVKEGKTFVKSPEYTSLEPIQ